MTSNGDGQPSIAERSRAELENELRDALERERRLRSVFDHAYQFIGVVSLDGIVLEANRSALDLIGVESGAVVGRHFADTPWWAHSPELRQRLRDAIDAAKGGELVRFEATHIAASGAVHTVDFSIKPLFAAEGTPSHLVCEGRDITDRKHAEEALRHSRSMLALVLDTIPVRVFWKDRDLRYLGCNTHFARDAGVDSCDAVLGKDDFDLAWRPQAELYRRDDRTVIDTGLPIPNYEEPQTSPQGKDLWLRTTKIPLRDSHGEIVGVLGVYEDVTERKLDEKQRLALEVRMQNAQKLESLGLLAGGIAHDFNNLLTAIVGNLELLRIRNDTGPNALPMLDGIGIAAQRAADLCKQLLAYSGRGRTVVGPVDVNALVREMSTLLRVSLRKKGTLTLALDDALPPIEADATQIRQVMMNLITNASDALGESHGEIRLRTSRTRVSADGPREQTGTGVSPGEYVVVEVDDTGCGMNESVRERMFEPFFTTKETGRGFGLAAVLGIVHAHRGTLHVESAPSKGTRFRILLPAASRPTLATAPPAEAPIGSWRGRGRVLLVDDEPELLAAGAKLVASLGFDVETATDGREAIERYEAGKFVCVVVDLTMPRIDGLETTRALRARDPSAKIVLTSGYAVHDLLVRFDRNRPDAFLEKPFSLAKLAEVLRRIVAPEDRSPVLTAG